MNAKVSATARTKAGQVFKVVAVAAAFLVASSAALAESHGGGGHGGGFGGGGHASAPHFSGHAGGFSGAPHFAAGQHFSGGQHFAPSIHAQIHGGVGYSHGVGAAGFGNHYAYGGRVAGGFGYHNWGGGYWRGGYWPRAYYGWSYPLYLGLLPAVYATYWWGGLPYYYVNNVYYTYNPGQNGYVATDPPPVSGDYSDDVNAAAAADGNAADNIPPDVAGPNAGIIAYPRNGQSEQQQSTDKFECHNWAKGQTGFDPTSQSSANANAGTRDTYGRALAACLDGRGYTVR